MTEKTITKVFLQGEQSPFGGAEVAQEDVNALAHMILLRDADLTRVSPDECIKRTQDAQFAALLMVREQERLWNAWKLAGQPQKTGKDANGKLQIQRAYSVADRRGACKMRINVEQ